MVRYIKVSLTTETSRNHKAGEGFRIVCAFHKLFSCEAMVLNGLKSPSLVIAHTRINLCRWVEEREGGANLLSKGTLLFVGRIPLDKGWMREDPVFLQSNGED